MTDPSISKPASRARRWRGYRLAARVNFGLSLVLAILVLVLANLVAHRVPWRRDLSRDGQHQLSETTRLLLEKLERDVAITVLVRPTHELASPVRDLLREYSIVAPRIRVDPVDPYRDVSRVQALADQYGVQESTIVLFESGSRQRIVDLESIAEFDYLPVLAGGSRRLRAFHGESAFSAAIHAVSDMTTPIVYYLRGYGERDLNDPHPVSGYSAMARLIRSEQVDLRELRLSEAGGIPPDADLLMLVGARRRLSAAELAILGRYLESQGRLLLLLDQTDTGVETLLPFWGLGAGHGTVGGITLSGSELFINRYGEHPITQSLQGITSVFYRPRPLRPDDQTVTADDQADRPRVSVLAAGREVLDPHDPSRVLPAAEHPPVVVAAVEKGLVRSAEVRLRPTRIVVFGDADFMSNTGMVAGNPQFFVNAMNWLLERDRHLAMPPQRAADATVLLLPRRHLAALLVGVVGILPFLFLAWGLMVRWIRGIE